MYIDWAEILTQLQTRFSMRTIAKKSCVAKSTLYAWKSTQSEPTHSKGESLIEFWCKTFGKPREQCPIIKHKQINGI
ncbi:hypothetical protein [Thiolinea disciformis]|uniref:hypothetical protein n=1 Tax=Thiolinea disciformis TaxID=125614 RepID=UPI00035DD83D|nr:hypothetical protein [Thiolinea disciformis]